jgi:hypothetical protein
MDLGILLSICIILAAGSWSLVISFVPLPMLIIFSGAWKDTLPFAWTTALWDARSICNLLTSNEVHFQYYGKCCKIHQNIRE